MTDCTIAYRAALRPSYLLRAHWKTFLLILTLCLFTLLAAAPARAFETVKAEDFSSSAAISAAGAIAPDEPATRPAGRITFGDPCLPLLNNLRPGRGPQYTNRSRFGGDENTVGFVFGIRLALGSSAETKPHNNPVQLDLWQPGNRGDSDALAIAGYRHCKTDAALKALMEE